MKNMQELLPDDNGIIQLRSVDGLINGSLKVQANGITAVANNFNVFGINMDTYSAASMLTSGTGVVGRDSNIKPDRVTVWYSTPLGEDNRCETIEFRWKECTV